MASRGKMLKELALKKATQQQSDQILAIKADKSVQKDSIPGLDVSITMSVRFTVTEILDTVLGSDLGLLRQLQPI